MRGSSLSISFLALFLFSGLSFGQYFQDFDAETVGDSLVDIGDDWATWDGVADTDLEAEISDAQAFSGDNSVEVVTTTDIVREFTGFDSGGWTVSVRIYIPEDMTGEGFFILLNNYSVGGDKNWSSQIVFNADTGEVESQGGTGTGENEAMAFTAGVWIEVQVRVNLDENTQSIFIDGVELSTLAWYDEDSTTALAEIACVDLFGNTATDSFFVDDLQVYEDCDGDGVDDVVQLEMDPDLDCDDNGVMNVCDIDCDDNGMADGCEILDDSTLDCDDNGVLNVCDEDCDDNGLADACEIQDAPDLDCDDSGVLDACEEFLDPILFVRGDPTGDGLFGLPDLIASLEYQFTGGEGLCVEAMDMNDDGIINLTDVFDHATFIFLDGADPAAPYPDCGEDLDSDGLDCTFHCDCL